MSFGALSQYGGQCIELAREMIQTLCDDEIEVLRIEFREKGAGVIGKWIGIYESEILKFVRATPSQRNKTAKWNRGEVRPMMLYCSYLLLLRAGWHLETADDLSVLVPGMKYRHAAAFAIEKLLSFEHPSLWPFDDDDPFVT